MILANSRKVDQERLLKEHLAGVSRKPALLFGSHESMCALNLGNYEVSPIEPLHDLKGHIKNVWELLPKYLSDELKSKFGKELETALGNLLIFISFYEHNISIFK